MTLSNGNIFRVTGHLCGEFPGEFHAQRPVTRSFDVFYDVRLSWVNNREAGDLGRYRAHYDVTVMHRGIFILTTPSAVTSVLLLCNRSLQIYMPELNRNRSDSSSVLACYGMFTGMVGMTSTGNVIPTDTPTYAGETPAEDVDENAVVTAPPASAPPAEKLGFIEGYNNLTFDTGEL